MKRFLCVTLETALILALLCGCGNHSAGLGNYSYKTVHVCDHAGNCRDFTIKKWYNNETGVEVDTEEAGDMFLSEGIYILFEGDCPLCNNN